MRILFVAPPESIHTARWLAQLADAGWDLHLYPSFNSSSVHPDLRGVEIHGLARGSGKDGQPAPLLTAALRRFRRTWTTEYRTALLQRTIARLKPDLVHSMDIQSGGYLCLAARNAQPGQFPKWISSNWGSDVYLFGRLAAHRDRVRAVLSSIDYAFCECQRDADLMREHGFRGEQFPLVPAGGGFRLEELRALRSEVSPSRRGIVLLKGYQTWAGRALVALRALERCADLLRGREIRIFSPSDEVSIAAELFQQRTGVTVTMVPHRTHHSEMLRLHAAARIYIGLSISDAISLSLLEAMAMGAFPVQSCTACADEWIEDARTGMLVPPEDVDIVEEALRRALSDDDLVDRAALENMAVIERRIEWSAVRDQVIRCYQRAAGRS